jgi:hypothetical protein
MSNFLFAVQQKNRLEQKGLLKRFSIICYGHQDSLEEMRAQKAAKFKELQNKKGTEEYEEWFLNYKPNNKDYKKEMQKEIDKQDEKDEKIRKHNKGKKNKTYKNREKKSKKNTKRNKNIFSFGFNIKNDPYKKK